MDYVTRARHLLRLAVANTRGAIDLASIMVGVLVIGIIGGVIAATVFAVIPWSQDAAARSSLDAVRTAQGVQLVKEGSYGTSASLDSAKVLASNPNILVETNAAGDCYVGVSRSATGLIYYQSDLDPAPLVYGSGATSECTDLAALINPMLLAGSAAGQTPIVNLVTNPSFETATGSAVARTNLIAEPQPRVSGTAWGGAAGVGGGATRTVVTNPSQIPGAATAMRSVWTTAPTSSSSLYLNAPTSPLAAGVTYTLSMYAQFSWSNPSPYLYASPMPTNQVATDLGGGLFRLSARFTPAAAGVYTVTASTNSSGSLPTVGSTMFVSQAMAEMTTAVNPYFDGGTAAAGDFSYSWAGTAGASISHQRAPAVNGLRSGTNGSVVGAAGTAYQATDPEYGKIARWTAPAGTTPSQWRVFEYGQAFDPSKVKAGETYTMLARVRSTGWATAPNFTVGLRDGNATNAIAPGDGRVTLPVNGEWADLRYTFTATADARASTEFYGAFAGGPTPPANVDGVVEMASIALIPGDYSGPMFDGDASGAYWLGAPHASPSLRY